jgi:hypothetical protein
MNTQNTPAGLRRFEPNLHCAWGQMIAIAAFAAVFGAVMDIIRFPDHRNGLRFVCVCVGLFGVLLSGFWMCSVWRSCQTLIVDKGALTVESKKRREVLPWTELSEITLVGDALLTLQCRSTRDPLRLESTGFTREQWAAIKQVLQSRGYELKTSTQAM